MTQPIRKAVFPVAGLGTRFLPATKACPKELLTLVDRPLIQHVVEEAKAAGIEQFIFVNSRGKSALEDHFDHNTELCHMLEKRGKLKELQTVLDLEIPSGDLLIVHQSEPLGLGHAVWCARHLIGDEPFAVLLPDDVFLSKTPCMKQMVDAYQKVGGNLVATTEVPPEKVSRYGILDIDGEQDGLVKIKGLVEKPSLEEAPSNLCISGRYILQPEIFDALSAHQTGAGGEIQLTDSMAKLIARQDFYGCRYEGTRYDCGNKLGFLEANVAFSLAEGGEEVRLMLQTILH